MAKKPQNKVKLRDILLTNIPNFLTVSRIILSFVVMYLIFTHNKISWIIAFFVMAALTDFFDGQLARAFHWESEFGRQADMIADRFLWAGTAIAFVITYGLEGMLNWVDAIPLLLMMTREIVCTPFAIIAFFSGNVTPQARYIAKVTTFIQGFALPTLILSIYFYRPFIYIAWALAIAACITGFISALYYMNDIKAPEKKKK